MTQKDKAQVVKWLLGLGDFTQPLNVPEIHKKAVSNFEDIEGLTVQMVRGIVYAYEIPHTKGKKSGKPKDRKIALVRNALLELVSCLKTKAILTHEDEIRCLSVLDNEN